MTEESSNKKPDYKHNQCHNFEKSLRKISFTNDMFGWKDGKYTNQTIDAMFIGYKMALQEVLENTHGHFIIGKTSKQNNKVEFSEHPKIHHKYGLAMAEVNRLVEEHDHRFIVYKSVISRKKYHDPIETENKELPVESS